MLLASAFYKLSWLSPLVPPLCFQSCPSSPSWPSCHHFISVHACICVCVAILCSCDYMSVEVPGYCCTSSWLPSCLIKWGRVSKLNPELTAQLLWLASLPWAAFCLAPPLLRLKLHSCACCAFSWVLGINIQTLCVHGSDPLCHLLFPSPLFYICSLSLARPADLSGFWMQLAY